MPREGEVRVDCAKVRRLLLEECKLSVGRAERMMNISHSVLHRMMGGAKGAHHQTVMVQVSNASQIVSLASEVIGTKVPLDRILSTDGNPATERNSAVSHEVNPGEGPGFTIDPEATQQVSAAFRFGVQNERIDALPENLETLDRPIAEDIYGELTEKLRALADRLRRSNADPYACFVTDRLLQSLGSSFGGVRPGVILSRMRSIEAAIEAFNTDEGRQSLFPDALAMMNDVYLCGQDLLSTFPNVRRIERQRLALEIEKSPETIQKLLAETTSIQEVVSVSDVVTPGAVDALIETEPDINRAKNVEVKADLVADKLLVLRNFVSEAIRMVAERGVALGTETWSVVGPDMRDGARTAARILPPLAVIALLSAIAGPVAGLAGLLRGDIFRPVRSAITRVQSRSREASDKEIKADEYRRMATDNGQGIIILGKRFDTMKQACQRLDLSRATMIRYISDGFFPPPKIHSLGRAKMVRYFDEEWYENAEKKLGSARITKPN